jgi:hypothetical protein
MEANVGVEVGITKEHPDISTTRREDIVNSATINNLDLISISRTLLFQFKKFAKLQGLDVYRETLRLEEKGKMKHPVAEK